MIAGWKVAGVVAAGSAIVIGFMAFQVWRVEKKNEVLIRTNEGLVEQNAGLTLENVVQRMSGEKTDAVREAVDKERNIRDSERQEYENTINEMRPVAEQNAIGQPFQAGVDYATRLARIMCKFANLDDPEGRRSCSGGTISPASLGVNHPLMFTSGTASDYAVLCEAEHNAHEEREAGGEEVGEFFSDFCSYALVGLPVQGWLNFELWLNRAADLAANQHDLILAYQEQMKIVTNLSALGEKPGEED